MLSSKIQESGLLRWQVICISCNVVLDTKNDVSVKAGSGTQPISTIKPNGPIFGFAWIKPV